MRTAVLSLVILALAPLAGRAEDAPLAFVNATIETAGKAGRLEKATLILRAGKIEAVGTSVKVPDDVRTIDAQGKTIMPGMIDAFREVTIAGTAADAEPRVVVGRGGRGFQGRGGAGAGAGYTRVADNFYPFDPNYRALLRSGLTGLNLVTNGYGQSALVHVTPDQPEAMLANPDGILFLAVANDGSSLEIVRNALEAAERAKKGLPAVTRPTGPATDPGPATPPAGRRGGGRRGGGRGGQGPGMVAGSDAASQKVWAAIYEGKAPLLANVTTSASIVHLLKVLEPYADVQVIIEAPGPALVEALDHLTGRKVQVLLRPGLSLKPNTRDRLNIAQLLRQAGVPFAFTQPADPNELLAAQDFPLFAVAYLVRCGLPRQAALEAVTARPADVLGLGKTHGTIEPGKAADLLIFTGDPLDPASQLSQVLIQGRTVYEN